MFPSRFRTTCAVTLVTTTTIALVACTTDYQKNLEDPLFGNPNSLANATQPGPATDTASGGAVKALCVTNGGALVDAGVCAVSFKTDDLGAFKAANCQTAGSCHGGATPPNQPAINPDDPAGAYNAFIAFKLSTSKAYVNPCSTDDTQSGIAANVDSTAAATDRGTLMPSGVATGLPADQVTKIRTWLKCGAPNN